MINEVWEYPLTTFRRLLRLPYVSSANLLFACTVPALLYLTDAGFAAYNRAYTLQLNPDNLIIWAVLSLFVSLIRPASIRKVFFSICYGAALVQYLHFEFYGTYVPPIALYQFFGNLGEVTESFAGSFLSMTVPIILGVTGFGLTLLLDRMLTPFLRGHDWWTAAVPLLFLLQLYRIFLFSDIPTGKLADRDARRLYPISGLHSTENFLRSTGYFLVRILPRKFNGRTVAFPETPLPVLKTALPQRTVILIIGESLRADRLSLLGYPEPTTPLLDKIPDLAARPVYAGGTMTVTAVPVLLNMLRYPGISSGKAGLFRLAQENGFKTYFISAQTEFQTGILDGIIDRSSIDVYLNRTDFQKSDNGPHSAYDDCLISLLSGIDCTRSSFIVLQQRGSHSPYNKQYPRTYAQFKDPYDNTVLYTDFVISSVINHVEQHVSGERYVLFTSDHGELLGENGRHGHGWFLKPVYTVPFVCWGTGDLLQGADRVTCHYDVSLMLARMLGYDTQEQTGPNRTIYVNGSDIDLLAGYLQLEMAGDSLMTQQIIR